MGLEYVELMMEIEGEFDVIIPDGFPWPGDVTVGQIVVYVQGLVDSREETCLAARCFRAFRRALTAETGIDERKVRPSTHLAEIIPHKTRVSLWRTVKERLAQEGYYVPGLERPSVGCLVVSLLSILLGGLCAWVVVGLVGPALALTMGIVAFVASAVVTVDLLGTPSGREFPHRCITFADLARRMSPILAATDLAERKPDSCAVKDRIVELVARYTFLGSEQISLDSYLFRDLGLG